ncbi:MAG: Kae1-associated serine/threonine protein kinase [Euryarchaeota archaeon]|jgi:TP53 regulating kinase-like protein|nr:Kae1-associated serine/threonine protein kinase [Euryarchaeota archaeon]MBT5735493.1 Kae1-associated serine/threonine protein kinase [Euryarchaeota archaeon]MBT7459649.1 Kae1-associated serine/threonine protein kinase [Euryarchaeota archaeon]
MVFQPNERLHLGAEAEVWSGLWMGRQAVRKIRRKRGWRHPNLEKRLGFRRLLSEARLLIRARRVGLEVPAIWDVDLEKGILIMEMLPGRPLIELLRDEKSTQDMIRNSLYNSGALVRRLHRLAITHGDLSTNNILIDDDLSAHLVDFGLASIDYEVERFGIDLHVIDEILGASHPSIEGGIDIFLEGYLDEESRLGPAKEQTGGVVPSADAVMKRLEQVRSRVRYHG